MKISLFIARTLNSLIILGLIQGAINHSFAQEAASTKPILELTINKEILPPDYSYLNSLDNESKLEYTLNSYMSDYFQKQKQKSWLKDVDVSIILASEYQPFITLETIQSLSEDNNSYNFFQGHYQYQEDSSLTNFGFGNRVFTDKNKDSMAGYNVFYDYTHERNHSRIGFGLEYFKANAEYRMNFYMPLSGERKISFDANTSGIYERTASGLDFKMGTYLEKAPWLSINASGFVFDNDTAADEYGYEIITNLQLSPRFSLGISRLSSNQTRELYGRFLYTINETSSPSLWGNKVKSSTDIAHKRFLTVQRDYSVKKITIIDENKTQVAVEPQQVDSH